MRKFTPALTSLAFVVLTDRYIYSLMARSMVRGLDSVWVRNIHRFAPKPDAVFYLRISVDELIPRAVFTRGFDYWESGMDLYSAEDMYDSFRKYQTALLQQFDQLAEEFSFDVIDARPEPRVIFEQLKAGIDRILTPPVGRAALAIPSGAPETGEEVAVEAAIEERRKRA